MRLGLHRQAAQVDPDASPPRGGRSRGSRASRCRRAGRSPAHRIGARAPLVPPRRARGSRAVTAWDRCVACSRSDACRYRCPVPTSPAARPRPLLATALVTTTVLAAPAPARESAAGRRAPAHRLPGLGHRRRARARARFAGTSATAGRLRLTTPTSRTHHRPGGLPGGQLDVAVGLPGLRAHRAGAVVGGEHARRHPGPGRRPRHQRGRHPQQLGHPGPLGPRRRRVQAHQPRQPDRRPRPRRHRHLGGDLQRLHVLAAARPAAPQGRHAPDPAASGPSARWPRPCRGRLRHDLATRCRRAASCSTCRATPRWCTPGEYPQYGGGGEAWCSPTSTSMVLGYYEALPPQLGVRLGDGGRTSTAPSTTPRG